MRGPPRIQKTLALALLPLGLAIGGLCWWGNQTVDSIAIQNNSDETVYFVTGGSAWGCIGDVAPHKVDTLDVARFSPYCKQQLRFHFGDSSGRRFLCSWDSAKREQPVVVTATGASCE